MPDKPKYNQVTFRGIFNGRNPAPDPTAPKGKISWPWVGGFTALAGSWIYRYVR